MKWQFSNDAPIYAQLIAQIKVGIVSGEADHQDSVLTDKEKKANNTIMTCVSRGCGGKKLVLDI